MRDDDEILLNLCRLGNERAWRTVVDKYRRLVYSIPARKGLPEDDCADIFQATFVALHNELNQITSGKALARWLAVVAARETYRILRSRKTTVPMETLDEMLVDQERHAHAEAELSLDSEHLQDGLRRMDARCRTLLEMLYLKDASYAEIMSALGVPVGTIGPTRARCLDKLRKILGPGFSE